MQIQYIQIIILSKPSPVSLEERRRNSAMASSDSALRTVEILATSNTSAFFQHF